MLHRLLRTLRQPFALLAVLFMLGQAIAPASAAPDASDALASGAQDVGGTATIAVTAFACAPGSQPVTPTLSADEASSLCSTPAAGVDFHIVRDDIDTGWPPMGKAPFVSRFRLAAR
jgi:hypothetical protein